MHAHTCAHTGPIARPMSVATGKAMELRGGTNFTLTVPANTTRMLLFNPSSGAITGGYVDLATTPGSFSTSVFDLTTNLYSPLPDTFLPTRGTITILDTTPTLNRGGTARVLQFTQSLLLSNPPTNTGLTLLLQFLRGHPDSKPANFNHKHEYDLHFVDGIGGQQFRSFVDNVDPTAWTSSLDDPILNTFMTVFEPYTYERTFAITVHVTAYCRYPVLGPLSSNAKPIPHVSHETFHAANRAAAAHNSAPHRIGEAMVSGVAEAAAEAAYDLGRGAVRLAGSAARRAARGWRPSLAAGRLPMIAP